jgi:hypothetical protein
MCSDPTGTRTPRNSEADTTSSEKVSPPLVALICKPRPPKQTPDRPHIPSSHNNVKQHQKQNTHNTLHHNKRAATAVSDFGRYLVASRLVLHRFLHPGH